jgi:ribosomal protein L20
MPRIKRGVASRARRKKILKAAKGYYGARSRTFKVAKQAVIKAGQYAYRDRRHVSDSSVDYGLSVLMRRPVNTACPTAALSLVSRRQG